MNRQLPKLIDEILAVIPKEEETLREQLDSVKQSATYATPEVMHEWWCKTASVLAGNIDDPINDWHWNVARIFSGDNTIGPQKEKEECRQG